MEAMKHNGNPLGTLVAPLGAKWKPEWSREPTEARVVQRDAKGRPRGSQKEAWEVALGHLGASLVKENFGSKTSKFAKAFDEK